MRTMQWCSQPKILVEPKKFGGVKRFDFRRITLFGLTYRLSNHKITIHAKNVAMAPQALLATPVWYDAEVKKGAIDQHGDADTIVFLYRFAFKILT